MPAQAQDSMDLGLPGEILEQIPQTELSTTALKHAFEHLDRSIFNHSLRTYLLSKWLAETTSTGSEWTAPDKLHLLLVAAMFHDSGTCDLYNGGQRFEVEGADAATAHLHKHEISERESHEVWVAIALHTSSGIAERISPFAKLLRTGVLIDFIPSVRTKLGAENYYKQIETYLPRLDIEKALADAVVQQALKIRSKAPAASWPNDLLQAHLADPEYQGVNKGF
ncbi:metal dependent phosphohydrolase [Myriangium duriaei CBS 260.36]|uniref:Metal dependent phosphohydrolase n=1 Tax=Myriangium duriaei CBS 260.36 TaxID=1168546 RepID=A0A9P4J7K0_9PEZI|nr:metal dependent phosphohydrolase [Myriangium duriaei CBS 260.36]